MRAGTRLFLSRERDSPHKEHVQVAIRRDLDLTNPAEFLNITGNRMVKAIERRPKEWDEKYNLFTKTFRDEVVSQSFLILDFF